MSLSTEQALQLPFIQLVPLCAGWMALGVGPLRRSGARFHSAFVRQWSTRGVCCWLWNGLCERHVQAEALEGAVDSENQQWTSS